MIKKIMFNERLSDYIEKNYGEIPRCRGYELMRLVEKYGNAYLKEFNDWLKEVE